MKCIIIEPTEVNPFYDVCEAEARGCMEGIVQLIGSFPERKDAEDYVKLLQD